jgi:hypothetical protein
MRGGMARRRSSQSPTLLRAPGPACLLLLSGVTLIAVTASSSLASVSSPRPNSCPSRHASALYADRIRRALAAGVDTWGTALLRSSRGPTYAGIDHLLQPLLFAGHPPGERRRSLTESGVYYLPFGVPPDAAGSQRVALHVADGSQIVPGRAGGARLTVYVGRNGGEPYGSCLARLPTPQLYGGYLPILETRYADAAGTWYRQESFVAWGPGGIPMSFVRVTAQPRLRSSPPTRVRFQVSGIGGLAREGNQLMRGGKTYLWTSAGGRFDGAGLTFAVGGRAVRTVFVARPIVPTVGRAFVLDGSTYELARQSVVDAWTSRLSEGATFLVPERRVLDAERNLLIQNLGLTWRYSLGNAYQHFEFPESLDAANVVAEYGFGDVAKRILQAAFRRPLTPFPNMKMGAELGSSAQYYRLTGDADFLAQVTPVLRRYLDRVARELRRNPRHLLDRERWASDLLDHAYGLNTQTIVLRGLRAMGQAWQDAGLSRDAAWAGRLAATLETGLRAAVRASARRLRDGSLFVPITLLDHAAPFKRLTASKWGSYWNLVMPYALTSGMFPPGSKEANGILRYLLRHGSRFLGLVRAGGYSLYSHPVYPTSGSDQVYGLHVAQFLADNHQEGQLILSLYGQLAAGMTHGTFVAGEAATLAPLPGTGYRTMFLPPNVAANATFLETLRLTLVHETESRRGRPEGLELAYGTPRAWLAPGKQIVVRDTPTSFGLLSFSLGASRGTVRASVDVPPAENLRSLRLRLRLPRGVRIASVDLDGRAYTRVDRATATIDLTGQVGQVALTVRTDKP